MDPSIHQLIDKLRDESCPREVVNRVRSRIALEKPESRGALPYLSIVAAVTVILFFVVGISYQVSVNTRSGPVEPDLIAETSPDPQKAMENTVTSLAYMGSVIMESCQMAEAQLVADSNGQLPEAYLKFRAYFAQISNQ